MQSGHDALFDISPRILKCCSRTQSFIKSDDSDKSTTNPASTWLMGKVHLSIHSNSEHVCGVRDLVWGSLLE